MYYYYKLFGFIVRSRVEIKQLFAIEDASTYDVEFLFAEAPKVIHDEIEDPENSEYYFWVGDDHMWFRNRYAIYAVFSDGRIYIENKGELDRYQSTQFVLGYGISMYAFYKDMIAVHCGAVTIKDKGIIITGTSGAGKSTLTLDIIESGARMVSDDVVAVKLQDGVPYIYPAFPQQKLCKDAAIKYGYDISKLVQVDVDRDKYAVLRHEVFESEPQKLQAMFVLHKYDPSKPEYAELGGKLFIQELEGFHKVVAIRNQLFLAALMKCMGLPPKQFEICVEIAKAIKIYDIYRPETADTLEEIKEFIYKAID